MNYEIKCAILDKIKAYDRILLSRHIRSDGDAVGSAKGLYTIIKDTFPEKEVYLVSDDYSAYTAFLGEEDTVTDDKFENALLIVLDIGTLDRLSNKRHALAKETIKIDHHIEVEPYGSLSWVEPWRSSCAEMIADFADTFHEELVLSPEAARYLYTGMVTDSGRFRFNSVKGDTLRLAGMLLDKGIDTEALFANLYLDEFDALKCKAHILSKIKRTKNGVAYLYIDLKTQEKLGMTTEQASALVSTMDAIKGSLCWIAFIETREGTIRVRLRSRFMHINALAEKYNGGGHACASGATVYSSAEKGKLLREADRLIKEYKATHEGWM